jgi:1-aminocyclopropane-1-carboxylate deaminase/D-cysteine desulfhydrase-like pyridoxal-dependent ACC family enzyme
MSNLSQFAGGSIKSIQRGVISMTSGGSTSGTATLSPSVDTTKTELRVLGCTADTSSLDLARAVLTNSTTVTATRPSTTSNTVISWEITERY